MKIVRVAYIDTFRIYPDEYSDDTLVWGICVDSSPPPVNWFRKTRHVIRALRHFLP